MTAAQAAAGRLFGRLIGASAADRGAGPVTPAAAGRLGMPADVALLDAVISAMPDPIMVLDATAASWRSTPRPRRWRRRCGAASRLSIALRMPELVEAIRRAGDRRGRSASNSPSACRSTRWFEAFVTPVSSQPAARRPASC